MGRGWGWREWKWWSSLRATREGSNNVAKTVKDDKQKRPGWMKRHDPRPPTVDGRGGHKNLEQLLEADPTVEGTHFVGDDCPGGHEEVGGGNSETV